MKKKIIAAAIMGALSSLSAPVHAQDEWTTAEVVLETSVVALLMADWYTSRVVLEHKYEESNPLLGRNPSNAKVNLYFTSVILGQFWLANKLSHNKRNALLGLMFVAEAGVVKHNLDLTIGVKANF